MAPRAAELQVGVWEPQEEGRCSSGVLLLPLQVTLRWESWRQRL